MKIILLSLCLCLITTNASARIQLGYQDTKESETTRYSITTVEETPYTIRYLSVGGQGSSEFHIDKKDGATLSWKRKWDGKSISAMREGTTIEIDIAENGKNRSKTIDVEDKIWIQRIPLSLQWFSRNEKRDKMSFFIINSKDFSLIDLVALRKKAVDIMIGPEQFEAINVIVTLPGFKSLLWKSNYWFREKDGLFLRYIGSQGPGSPETITELIPTSVSAN